MTTGNLLLFLYDVGQNIMTNNSVSILIESGNIFYQNFNTNENFCSFLLAQQDEKKAINSKINLLPLQLNIPKNILKNIYLPFQ